METPDWSRMEKIVHWILCLKELDKGLCLFHQMERVKQERTYIQTSQYQESFIHYQIKKKCYMATIVYPLLAMNHEHVTKLKQTSTFWNAMVVSGRGVLVLDCSFGARFKPNFSLWSKWLPLPWGKVSAKYHTTNKLKDKKNEFSKNFRLFQLSCFWLFPATHVILYM